MQISGLDVMVCYYALGEREKMKRGFQMLVEVPLKIDDEDKYTATSVSANNFYSLFENDVYQYSNSVV